MTDSYASRRRCGDMSNGDLSRLRSFRTRASRQLIASRTQTTKAQSQSPVEASSPSDNGCTGADGTSCKSRNTARLPVRRAPRTPDRAPVANCPRESSEGPGRDDAG
jgi:hypothetical protein